MGILSSIVSKWGTVPVLEALVPSTQVVLGEPIVGWPVPSVALQGYQLAKRTRSSGAIADTLTLRCQCVADSSAVIEQIVDAILAHLLPVSIGGGRVIQAWESYSLDLSRDPTSEQYSGSITLTCHVWET